MISSHGQVHVKSWMGLHRSVYLNWNAVYGRPLHAYTPPHGALALHPRYHQPDAWFYQE